MSKLAFLVATLMGAAMLAAAGCASTPMEQAIVKQDQSALRALLDSGVDVNADVGDQLTPLALAARKGNNEAIRELLGRGRISILV